jgi:DNA-binding MarR family transcriptional regulator
LISREASAGSDKRARSLKLTREGMALLETAKDARRNIVEAALERLSAEQRLALAGIIEQMFPALVAAGDDTDVVCRFCDEKVCPIERCPVPQHHAVSA